MKKLFQKIKLWLPLILVVVIWFVICIKNIKWGTYYTGWDNIHAEFDLLRYARQVFFGSWLEHQGLGAPMGLSHLSEIFRLPILWVLKFLLPDILVRYVFIFMYYLIGGVGFFFYLKFFWISGKSKLKDWLASLGAIFYMLHILTLQQFYISFELFAVQFAFLPFLLISIHLLSKKINSNHIFLFILTQFLIAPSGHTATLFYLGTLLTLIYAFFITINRGFIKALAFSFIIGLITLLSNSYWILPNLYYGFNNAIYVQESRDNQLFGPESVWSIKEASTWPNFFKGTHYLFSWKDYSFENQEFDFIFNEWEGHLGNPAVSLILLSLGVMTVLGCGTAIFNKKKGNKRWAIILIYLLSASFIWFDLFPTEFIFEKFYQSSSFLEAFRNPFTKLSIIYSFVSVLLFVEFLEFVVRNLHRKKLLFIKGKTVASLFLLMTILAIIYSAWPSFEGHFISEKLKVKFPPVYQEMFKYLQGRDKDLRILQLPQLSHAGWEYYDWQFLEKGNGYQGMGFYFFGFPQPFLNRDSDRWVETSDFFYFELKSALDTQDANHLEQVFQKYRVDLVIVDETKIEPKKERNYEKDHQLLKKVGLEKIWEKDFLTIYERVAENTAEELFIPKNIQFIIADTNRVSKDFVYQNEGGYLEAKNLKEATLYPLANLMARKLTGFVFTDEGIKFSQKFPEGDYNLSLPKVDGDKYFTPVALSYKEGRIEVKFPTQSFIVGSETTILPKINDFQFEIEEDSGKIIVFFDDQGIVIDPETRAFPVLALDINSPVEVSYASSPAELKFVAPHKIDNSQLVIESVLDLEPDWFELTKEISLMIKNADRLQIISQFPVTTIDLLQNPSVNCSFPVRGSISTEVIADAIIYKAQDYAVNCNGFTFDYISPAYSYLLNIVGNNVEGRGTKFFINYVDKNVTPGDYLMREDENNVILSLHQISANPTQGFNLNWETRSFGKTSINDLQKIQISPFPLDRLAGLKLEKGGTSTAVRNDLELLFYKKYLDSVFVVDFNCMTEKCYLGLDQSYDDLWLSFEVNEWSLLPHYRYNNWGNAWEVEDGGKIVIFYLPELISLLSLSLVLFSFSFLIFLNRKKLQGPIL